MQENQTKNDTLVNTEIEELAYDFFNKYFSDIYSIIDFNMTFLEDNDLSYKTDIDYMKLTRFVTTTYNTMLKIDPSFNYSLLSKFNKDLVTLNKVYKQFVTKHEDIAKLYSKQFLMHHKGIENLSNKLKNSGKNLELPYDIDELNEFIKIKFIQIAKKEIDSCKEDFKKIINTKYYYFDHLLYYEAKKSVSIKAYYKKSLGKNVISTKLYIKQYLNSVDKDNSSQDKFNLYLHKVITMMDS